MRSVKKCAMCDAVIDPAIFKLEPKATFCSTKCTKEFIEMEQCDGVYYGSDCAVCTGKPTKKLCMEHLTGEES